MENIINIIIFTYFLFISIKYSIVSAQKFNFKTLCYSTDMITLSPDAKLSIILPNTNKAFAEAVKNATPDQLNQLKEGKDIKSLLTSVFQDKITSSKSDQALLDILKNGAAFKNMGNFADDLKSLLTELKSTPLLAQKSDSLEEFFKNITSMDTPSLKSQLANSGVFMESKIAAAVQIFPSLKETLGGLQQLLSRSTLPEAKALNATIGSLLEAPILNHPPSDLKSAVQIADTLKKVTDTLRGFIAKSDVLYSKEISQFAQKIDQLIRQTVETPPHPKEAPLSPQKSDISTSPSALPTVSPPTPQEIKATLSQLYGILLTSKAEGSNPVLDSIELLLKNLGKENSDPLLQLKEFSTQLHGAIASGDVVVSPEATELVAKLDEFAQPKELLIEDVLKESMKDDLKSGLMKLSEELQSSTDPKAEKLLEHVDKLLTQIDYHQLTSHLSASNSIYFPFAWDQLEEGSVAFKKTKEKKFYCEINLRLKEYGELNLMMGLYDGNQIEIQAHTQKAQLKELIQENISQLRTLLINAGLTPRAIRVYETKEAHNSASSDAYGTQTFNSDFGFEVKV